MKKSPDIVRLLREIDLSIEANFKKEHNIGILSGLSGILLFKAYYSKYYQNCNGSLFNDLITVITKKIEKGEVELTFCSGLAGYGWTINHLKKMEIIDIEVDEYLSGLDELLQERMALDFIKKKFDFLHGGLGYSFYFFNRYLNCSTVKLRKRYYGFLSISINEIENLSIKDKNGRIKWAIPQEKSDKISIYNLGLAHGIPSILYFLCLLVENNLFLKKSIILLQGGVEFILDNLMEEGDSIFPTAVSDFGSVSPLPSRLAWCYGDLGILKILKKASTVLEDSKLSSLVDKLLFQTSKRRDLESNFVTDAPICHGTFGLFHMFNRWDKIDGFKTGNTTRYWLQKGMEFYEESNSLEGFKTKNTQMDTAKLDFGLLEGLSGIGLTLISEKHKDFSWDTCLMLD